MNLWYEQLELAEEQQKHALEDACNWERLQEALKAESRLVHPAARLFNQINERAQAARDHEAAQSEKEKRHVQ